MIRTLNYFHSRVHVTFKVHDEWTIAKLGSNMNLTHVPSCVGLGVEKQTSIKSMFQTEFQTFRQFFGTTFFEHFSTTSKMALIRKLLKV